MLDFIIVASFIITILLIWFQTNAIAEYINLFGLGSLISGFNNNKESHTLTDYFIKNKDKITKNKIILFFIKLVTCVYCLNTWLCIIGSLILSNILFAPVLYVVTLLGFFKITKSFF